MSSAPVLTRRAAALLSRWAETPETDRPRLARLLGLAAAEVAALDLLDARIAALDPDALWQEPPHGAARPHPDLDAGAVGALVAGVALIPEAAPILARRLSEEPWQEEPLRSALAGHARRRSGRRQPTLDDVAEALRILGLDPARPVPEREKAAVARRLGRSATWVGAQIAQLRRRDGIRAPRGGH